MEPNETTETVALSSTEPVVVTPPEPSEGSRMKTMRMLLGLGAVMLLAVGGVSALLYSSDPEAAPTVSWAPSSLYASLAVGESTTATAMFTPTENATNVSVWVVPELAPYVSVSPTLFASVQKGASYPVTVTMSASADMVVGVYEGTMQLRQGTKTLAVPLSLRLLLQSSLSAEETLAVLVESLRAGDRVASLAYFEETDKRVDIMNNYPTTTLLRLADFFGNAELQDETETFRVYKGPWMRGGREIRLEFSMTRNPDGHWFISTW